MITKSITVALEGGMDVRPVALLVQEASKYDSTIHILVDNKKVNAKSIMGMMSLGVNNGAQIDVCADGSDDEAAVQGIENFLSGKQA